MKPRMRKFPFLRLDEPQLDQIFPKGRGASPSLSPSANVYHSVGRQMNELVRTLAFDKVHKDATGDCD